MSIATLIACLVGIGLLVLGGVLRRRTTRPAPAPHYAMETLSEAVERLGATGYGESFQARPDGLLGVRSNQLFAPESLLVEEVVRFEGASDPGDEAVIFALASSDRSVRGTFVAPYGPHVDPDTAEMVRRLADTR